MLVSFVRWPGDLGPKLGLASIAAAGALLGAPAPAAVYTDSITVSTADIRCGYFATEANCYAFYAFDEGDRVVAAGDIFNVSVMWEDRLVVPGSAQRNLVTVQTVDETAVLGGGAPGPYESRGTLVMQGYEGPPNPISGPVNLNHNFGYNAVGGFCCGYGVPNGGFSLTGATVSIEALNDGVRPMIGYIAGYVATLPAAPDIIEDLPGGSPDSPTILPPGLIGRVTGRVGGDFGDEAFYGFTWGGGIFQTLGQVLGAEGDASYQFILLNEIGELQNLTLDSANDFTGLMTAGLDPGLYRIGLQLTPEVGTLAGRAMLLAEPGAAFQLDFFTPIGVAAVPEPASWAMMIAGFGLVGGRLRRRPPQLSRA